MPNAIYTFENLQTLEQFKPEIVDGVFTFDESTEDVEFVDMSGHEELKEIVFNVIPENLRYLDASRCNIKRIEIPVGLKSLETLYLHSNHLQEITFNGNCPRLELLDLSNNELTRLEMPFEFQNLGNLFLAKNKFTDLTSIAHLVLKKHFDLNIEENEVLNSPPKEIVKGGDEKIIAWFEQAEKYKTEKAYEAKILIIGEPAAGKTTLMKLLFDRNTPVPEPEQKSTLGVAIKPNREFKNPDDSLPPIKAHIWDFGGQDIQYHLHQYFLSDDSVYILITDGRSGKTRYGYWFHIINLLAPNSPVLVLLNRNHDYETVIPFEENKWKDIFGNLKIINCGEIDFAKLDKSWDAFEEKIAMHLADLPVVGQMIIRPWKIVRDEIEKLREQKYVGIGVFKSICENAGIKDEEDISFLLNYYHKIGIALNFDDIHLQNYVFLDPNWITQAIYDVLKDEKVIDKNGEFEQNNLFKHWKSKECNEFHTQPYSKEECGFLLSLMLKDKFDICYPVGEHKEGYYVVPLKLPDKTPEYDLGPHKKLHFRFQYSFMPHGIISRLIVRLHRKIFDGKVWLTGAIFQGNDCLAEVTQRETDKEGLKYIGIKVAGEVAENRRALLREIRNEIEYIHENTFPYIQPSEMIVCNCEVCDDSKDPNFYKLRTIEAHLKGKKKEIFCEKSEKDVPIKNMLMMIYSAIEIDHDGKVKESTGEEIIRKYNEPSNDNSEYQTSTTRPSQIFKGGKHIHKYPSHQAPSLESENTTTEKPKKRWYQQLWFIISSGIAAISGIIAIASKVFPNWFNSIIEQLGF